jgi:endoglucanase
MADFWLLLQLQTLVDWLKINDRQAILSETGGINSDQCAQLLGEELAYIVENKDTIAGFAAWASPFVPPLVRENLR